MLLRVGTKLKFRTKHPKGLEYIGEIIDNKGDNSISGKYTIVYFDPENNDKTSIKWGDNILNSWDIINIKLYPDE